MKQEPLAIARRYARALFDVALEKGSAAALVLELRAAGDSLTQYPELARILAHPTVPLDRKKAIASSVWRSNDPLFARLISLLLARGRLGALPGLADSFLEMWNQHRGVVAAQAILAVPATSAQEEALASSAGELAGRTVTLETSVDPKLMGGVVLRMNGRTYDGSLRTQLDRLRVQLTSSDGSSQSTPSHSVS